MKKITIFIITLLAILMMSSMANAQDNSPQAPAVISSWSLSPNPAAIDGTLTTDISFTFNSTDTTTRFCITGPSNAGDSDLNWHGIMPATIPLTLRQGFITESVSFAKAANLAASQAVCGPNRNALYTGTHTVALATSTNTDVTTATGSSINLTTGGNVASTGIGNWVLFLEEGAGGSPNSLAYSLELQAAQTPITGLSGRLIDSRTLQPWVYGAEIQVVQTTGTNTGLKGSTVVTLGATVPGDPSQSDGQWSITFGTTDDLSLCAGGGGCTIGNEFATYQVQVNFTCNLNTTNGTRPAFDSSDDTNCPIQVDSVDMTGVPINFEFTVTDTATGSMVNLGDAETERGPTAVNLLGIDVGQNQAPQAALLVVILFGLAVSGAVVWRRRSN